MTTSTNLAQAATKDTATLASAYSALRTEPSAHIVPADHVPLTPEGLLFFCQSQLRGMDDAIAKKMKHQTRLVDVQNDVTNIQTEIKAASDGFVEPEIIDGINEKLDAAIANAKECGDGALAKNLVAVKDRFNAVATTVNAAAKPITGEQNATIGAEDAKELGSMLDATLTACRSGAEISMIELQSLVAKRGTALQLTTGMMNSLNEGSKSIAGNIGR